MISVTIIGSGNVGTHLFKAFKNINEIQITQWFSRKIDKLKNYSKFTDITDDLEKLKLSDIYILAVSDDSINKVSKALPFSNKLVVHTSGSIGINRINKKNLRGVFYPLQTFSNEKELDFTKVPICLEAERKESLRLLKDLTSYLNTDFHIIDSLQRETLHLSAVLVNNFTNHLFTIAKNILEENNLDFDILKPLISETVNKIYNLDPEHAQTGPAIRKDNATISKHLKKLDNMQEKELYKLMTSLIINYHEKKL